MGQTRKSYSKYHPFLGSILLTRYSYVLVRDLSNRDSSPPWTFGLSHIRGIADKMVTVLHGARTEKRYAARHHFYFANFADHFITREQATYFVPWTIFLDPTAVGNHRRPDTRSCWTRRLRRTSHVMTLPNLISSLASSECPSSSS